MQISGAVGKGDGLGINWRLETRWSRALRYFFLLIVFFFFLYLLAVRLRLGIDNVVEQPPRTISRTNRIRGAHRVSASNGQGREGERNRDDE